MCIHICRFKHSKINENKTNGRMITSNVFRTLSFGFRLVLLCCDCIPSVNTFEAIQTRTALISWHTMLLVLEFYITIGFSLSFKKCLHHFPTLFSLSLSCFIRFDLIWFDYQFKCSTLHFTYVKLRTFILKHLVCYYLFCRIRKFVFNCYLCNFSNIHGIAILLMVIMCFNCLSFLSILIWWLKFSDVNMTCFFHSNEFFVVLMYFDMLVYQIRFSICSCSLNCVIAAYCLSLYDLVPYENMFIHYSNQNNQMFS